MHVKKAIPLLSWLLLVSHLASAQNVRIGVFGLFRPHELTLAALPDAAIVVRAGQQSFVLEWSSGREVAQIRISGDAMMLEVGSQTVQASQINASSRSGGAVDFVLAVPGKINRRYSGTLEVKSTLGVLVPIVGMDLETAVASVVQAESAPNTSLEALKAQAVATRSYFVAAKGRHHNFDFCDTTHCQFLREPPAPGSRAALATRSTQGLVLAYRDRPFAAMFTRSCSGRTRTPAELGVSNHGYPYFPVVCDYCRTHPAHWSSQVSQDDADRLIRFGEAARLEIGRRLGWNAVPSNDFTRRALAQQVLLEGSGQGHGIGLCQRGARAMAAAGADFRQILDHYYPNATLVTVNSGVRRWASFQKVAE